MGTPGEERGKDNAKDHAHHEITVAPICSCQPKRNKTIEGNLKGIASSQRRAINFHEESYSSLCRGEADGL